MSGKVIFTFLLLAGLVAGAAVAEQLAYFPFEEGQGTETADVTGNGNDGTFNGDVQWVAGYRGSGVRFDTAGERIVIGPIDPTAGTNAMTLAAWINWEGEGHSIEQQGIIGKRLGWESGATIKWFWQTNPAGDLLFRADAGDGGVGLWWGNGLLPPFANEWTHVALTWENNNALQYINGEEVSTGTITFRDTANDTLVTIGCVDSTNTETFVGIIDEVRIYDAALGAETLQQVMLGDFTSSSGPVPSDTASDIPQDAILSWSPGDLAVAHDVYFGTSRADVDAADRSNPLGVLVSQGQTGLTYDPPGLLDFAQTYYWRVDEVNAAPDSTIFKGAVWSFMVEPLVYPIENVIATASHAEAGSEAANTVNGSGLDADSRHGINAADMWLAHPGPGEPLSIQYEFDQVRKLDEMWVWNYNVQFEMALGFGLKDVTIEYSTDGAEWTTFGDVEFARAPASRDYVHNTTVDLSGVSAKYIRLNVNSGQGPLGQFGLSEVRFYYKPVQAREPRPASGQENVALSTALDWRSGREAVAHELYLSADQAAVAEGTALIDTLDESRYQVDGLNLGTTYYWKVNEVNEAATPASWEGAIWSFATKEYIVVEDFESYNDDLDAGTAIFQTWFDGWEDEAFGGSQVGHTDAPFAETATVRSGQQAMPLFYDNTGLTLSETKYTFAAQNWATNGVRSLSLFFAGDAANSGGQLYVKINNTRIDYDGSAADIAKPLWQPWNIDLSAVGSVSSVRSLTIGIAGAGATGVVYVDDIRLYPGTPEYVTPVEPDTAGLVAHYTFDGNANDSSGNGFNGTENGAPTYTVGVDGQAIQLNGTADYVVVDSVGISGAAPRTISGWAKADTTTITAWTNVFGFSGAATNGQHFDIQAVGDTGTTTLGYYGLHRYGWEQNILPIDLEWHHLAATLDGTTATWYGDGMPIGSEDVTNVNTPGPVHVGKRQDNENFFPGAVDDVHIYDRALSDGEIAWLAGKRQPAHKPF